MGRVGGRGDGPTWRVLAQSQPGALDGSAGFGSGSSPGAMPGIHASDGTGWPVQGWHSDFHTFVVECGFNLGPRVDPTVSAVVPAPWVAEASPHMHCWANLVVIQHMSFVARSAGQAGQALSASRQYVC